MVYRYIKYQETGSIARRPGSGRHYKIMAALVEQKMREDHETVAVQLHVHAMLKEHGYNTSLRTILRCWMSLGWTFRGSKYRQLIRQLKRFELAWPYITVSFELSEVSATSHAWTDESSMQLESHQ